MRDPRRHPVTGGFLWRRLKQQDSQTSGAFERNTLNVGKKGEDCDSQLPTEILS